MRSVSALIDDLGGDTAVAGVLGLKAATTVASWKARKSIPVKHWPRVVNAARERGLDDVSYENLVSMHSERVPS